MSTQGEYLERVTGVIEHVQEQEAAIGAARDVCDEAADKLQVVSGAFGQVFRLIRAYVAFDGEDLTPAFQAAQAKGEETNEAFDRTFEPEAREGLGAGILYDAANFAAFVLRQLTSGELSPAVAKLQKVGQMLEGEVADLGRFAHNADEARDVCRGAAAKLTEHKGNIA